MPVQLLEQEKDWVIGHRIVDVKANEKEVRIKMDDGKQIIIRLEKDIGFAPKTEARSLVYFEAELSHQVGIPGCGELWREKPLEAST